jgi:hypothetical protein
MGLGDPEQSFGIQELYRPAHEPAEIKYTRNHESIFRL